MTPDRKAIGSCAICFEESGELTLAYFRRNFTHPRTGKRMADVPMCKAHSNKVTRYGHPYERRWLSPQQADEIVRRYDAGGVTMRELANELGFSWSTIQRAIQRARKRKK